MRILVLLLLLLNIGFFAWTQGWLAGAGLSPDAGTEPLRMARQIAPDSVRVLGGDRSGAAGASAPAATTAPPPKALPAASDPASSPASAASHVAAVAATTGTVCNEIGPYGAFEATALNTALATLKKSGFDPQQVARPLSDQWMVWLGPLADKAAVQAELAKLEQTHLKTYGAVTDRPRYEPGISLGVFATEDAARAQVRHVEREGVTGAKVVSRNVGLGRTLLRLPAITASQARQLVALPSAQLGGQSAHACAG